MNRQLTFPIGERMVRVFLEEGFYSERFTRVALHRHCYPEIHWIMEGAARYQVGQQIMTLQAGAVLLIPARVFHCCEACEGALRRIAFQTDAPWSTPEKRQMSAAVMEGLLPGWPADDAYRGTVQLTALLHTLCALFHPGDRDYAVPIQDPSLIVEEFFSRRYHEPVTAADLAEALILSEKQTHRLVLRLTGNTFRRELTARRLEVAEQLLRTGEYTLSQIAEYVGYRSYSGFWKACRQNGLLMEKTLFPENP